MRHRRLGLKALGLCLVAALAVMAFSAAAAQASEWKIENAAHEMKSLSELGGSETISGTLVSAGKLTVPALGLELTCSEAAIEEAQIESGGGGKGKATFKGCTVIGAEAVCTVPPIVATANVLVHVHEGLIYIIFHPLAGKTEFTKVTIEGEECSAATTNELVTGDAVFTAGSSGLPYRELWSVVPATPTQITLLKTLLTIAQLKYGNQNAALEGGLFSVILSGAHKGLKWGAE